MGTWWYGILDIEIITWVRGGIIEIDFIRWVRGGILEIEYVGTRWYINNRNYTWRYE